MFVSRSHTERMGVSTMRQLGYERTAVPPLSQSRHSDMACETLYAQKHVQPARVADSEAAARGIEIHRILAIYLSHLVESRRATDLELLDSLLG